MIASTHEDLNDQAYDAFEHGELAQASRLFAQLIEHYPKSFNFHYMRGLAHKYLRDWPSCLAHNLRSLELRNQFDPASAWNAGIAATALGDWQRARELWTRCGMRIPEGDGPIEGDFGLVSIRLNAWDTGETVFARRIDIVRARLLNVPLPESGYRFGDIVLHDGARTGEREVENVTVPVFNALARLAPSDFRTFTVFVTCATQADLEELEKSRLPGIGYVEDWTGSIDHICLRCSYGAPHSHHEDEDTDWEPERNLGIGAQSQAAVDKLLKDWTTRGPGRAVDGVEMREFPLPEPEDGQVWWDEPEDESDDLEDDDAQEQAP